MILSHFYAKYGLALVLQKNKIVNAQDINYQMLINTLQEGLDHFRLQPRINTEANGKIYYQYASSEFLNQNDKFIRSHCNQGFFLPPNIISNDKGALRNWNAQKEIMAELISRSKFEKRLNANMTIMPLAAKFNNGKKSQSVPKASLFEAALLMITTTNPSKPSLHLREKQSNGSLNYISCAIIPDLELNDLIKFVGIFNDIYKSQSNNLLLGNVKREKEIKYFRPIISNGNFPFAPYRYELASAALLGAIGWFAKQAEYPNSGAEDILNKIKDRPLYIVSYGKAKSVHFNHFIVELAKENHLCHIVDSIAKFHPYLNDEKNVKSKQSKMDNYFLFASRFLQLFDKQSFKEFLSIRGEYTNGILELIKTFFRRVMKIDQEVINSAASLGKWLNNLAYFAANNELKGKDYSIIMNGKAKIIVELESAAYSAKTPSALVAQVITRAGRISGQDAPKESKLFIQKILEGNLGENEKMSLENAKNMIVVFARIKGENKSKQGEKLITEEFLEDEINESELTDDELE